MALQAASRAATLVQRLLAFARRQDLQPRSVDIVALLRGMQDLIRKSVGPMVEVAVDCPAELPPARIDPNQLELAILNLALNARDAMAGGGRLSISARAEQVGPGQLLAPGRYLRVAISDTGVGMDSVTLGHAVEPFFSTKGVGRGTGLGLSMVHGLCAQLGGTLYLRSKPGEGTTAEMWLPAATEPAGREETEPAPLVDRPPRRDHPAGRRRGHRPPGHRRHARRHRLYGRRGRVRRGGASAGARRRRLRRRRQRLSDAGNERGRPDPPPARARARRCRRC